MEKIQGRNFRETEGPEVGSGGVSWRLVACYFPDTPGGIKGREKGP